jgi:hypothetical protein
MEHLRSFPANRLATGIVSMLTWSLQGEPFGGRLREGLPLLSAAAEASSMNDFPDVDPIRSTFAARFATSRRGEVEFRVAYNMS